MTSSILYLAVIALLAARCVSADYWVTCEYTAIKSCLVELNYNQYSSSTAGASALASATNTNVRTISYSGTPTVSSFEKLLLLRRRTYFGSRFTRKLSTHATREMYFREDKLRKLRKIMSFPCEAEEFARRLGAASSTRYLRPAMMLKLIWLWEALAAGGHRTAAFTPRAIQALTSARSWPLLEAVSSPNPYIAVPIAIPIAQRVLAGRASRAGTTATKIQICQG